jgi:uncharacterized protein
MIAMNGLNEHGEIVNQAAHEKVAPLFLPLFEHVIQALLQAFCENLHSLYAYGSIAEGRARPGKSDADFIVVLHQVDASINPRLDALAEQIHGSFAELITKIDLPFGTVAEITAPDNHYGWGSYLKILGLPIYGPDLRAELPNFKPSLALARGWNGDLAQQIAHAWGVLRGEASAQEKQRQISKLSALIPRSFFLMIAPEINTWTPVLTEQVQHLIRYYPAQASHFNYLQQARAEGASANDFAQHLAEIEQELLPIFEAGIAEN